MIIDDLNIVYKYCPKCGKLFIHEKINLFKCNSCHHKLYINPVPCNAVIIKNSIGEFLFVKRKYEPAKDKWDLAGGFVDLGDNLEDSVIRELKEELGLNVLKKDISYFKSFAGRYLFSDINYYTLGMVFIAKVSDKALAEMTPMDDVKSYKFFKPEDIEWENIGFEVIKKAMKEYLEQQ